ncbi:hypothetical protein TEHN7128_1513 [Tetragenococcus halophilus subsp. halophilus]|uniref:HXXEE domain-containing protein n=2 Tax=Tetragenococcus halophilus TaxID=51669 RepID=A0A2H6CSW7_TETHA|nr:HXXEE domain-containing protein [Tetragenococcus halophilus]MCO8285286.1 HXXEE domain-containing protein [Tetragenococcus halophilus]MCO8297983.1 HXXEE domain-containing protein [Tetragenococcus halophilus]GBD66867.1 hypothetical protein TEHN7116_1831 [Tetragenococcus halophilus subsp. halophilus]GBD68090.1 hypothetical protein TEHN7118_0896 [Tetragenococcus halophilus subsp. halophilus]GBD78284.1 hypothetical protein TEHN7128_1513 [Tetragenococcus halophilus subsp. halophilus]
MFANVLWLPILFIIHDFEEIIFAPRWVKEHRDILSTKKRPLFGAVTNSSVFSVGVLEELIILLVISAKSLSNPNNVIYFSVLVGYTVHLFAHLLFCFQYKTYVPGVVTSVIQLPFFVLWIVSAYNTMSASIVTILFTCIVVFVLLIVNVLFLHYLMGKISI